MYKIFWLVSTVHFQSSKFQNDIFVLVVAMEWTNHLAINFSFFDFQNYSASSLILQALGATTSEMSCR